MITTWKNLAQGPSPLPGAFDQASCLGGNSSVKLQGAVRLPHQAVTDLRKEESCSLNHLLPLGVLLCNLGFPTRTRLDEMRNAAPTLSPPGCFLGTWVPPLESLLVCKMHRNLAWSPGPCGGLALRLTHHQKVGLIRWGNGDFQGSVTDLWFITYQIMFSHISSTWSCETTSESQFGDFLMDVQSQLCCKEMIENAVPLLSPAAKGNQGAQIYLFWTFQFKANYRISEHLQPRGPCAWTTQLCRYLNRYMCLQFLMHFAKAVSISLNRHLVPWTFTFLSIALSWSIHVLFVCLMERLLSLGQKAGNICNCIFGSLILRSAEQTS